MKKLLVLSISYVLLGASSTIYIMEGFLKTGHKWMLIQYPICTIILTVILIKQRQKLEKILQP